MAWERRSNGQRYFYVGRREGGKVVKQYYGSGPAAYLAEKQLTARKQKRLKDKIAVQNASDQSESADLALDQLSCPAELVPVISCQSGMAELSPDAPANWSGPAHTYQSDPISTIQALLLRLQDQDPTAGAELESVLNQFPSLWLEMGDVGEQAINAWLTLVSGGVPVLAMAAKKKLDALRAELLSAGTDVATKLHVDRVVATWLQVTYADARYAQADRSSLALLEFLARRQKQAQQQHLAALNAWRLWRRAQELNSPTAKPSVSNAMGSEQSPSKDRPKFAEPDGILPFPHPGHQFTA